MLLHDFGNEDYHEHDEEINDPDPSYNEIIDRNQTVDHIDWEEDRKKLRLTEDEINAAPRWMEEMKRLHPNIRKEMAKILVR